MLIVETDRDHPRKLWLASAFRWTKAWYAVFLVIGSTEVR